MHMFNNSGQSCNAPSRMIVPLSKMKEVAAIAKGVADKTKAGDPRAEGTTIGPVVNRGQWDKIQGLIQKGIEEGATLVAGGPGLPEGVNKGFYVRPTIFADVTENMTIAREEIFGPVLAIMGAKDEEDAVRIANDTPYGLAGYVSADTVETARKVGRRIRAGNVNLQGVPNERTAPFGGYKQSGNGREWGKYRLRGIPRGQGDRRLQRRVSSGRDIAAPGRNNIAPAFCVLGHVKRPASSLRRSLRASLTHPEEPATGSARSAARSKRLAGWTHCMGRGHPSRRGQEAAAQDQVGDNFTACRPPRRRTIPPARPGC